MGLLVLGLFDVYYSVNGHFVTEQILAHLAILFQHLHHTTKPLPRRGITLQCVVNRNRQCYPNHNHLIFSYLFHYLNQLLLKPINPEQILNHGSECLSLYKLLTQSKSLDGLDGHLLVDLDVGEALDDEIDLTGGLHAYLTDIVVTEFQADGEDVFEHCLCVVYSR